MWSCRLISKEKKKTLKGVNFNFLAALDCCFCSLIKPCFCPSFLCSTWWRRRLRCTSGARLPGATTVAWLGVAEEAVWVCRVGVVPVAPLLVVTSSHINVNNVWRHSRPITNWSSTYGCILEKSLTNARIVTDALSNSHMCSSIQDFILVSTYLGPKIQNYE